MMASGDSGKEDFGLSSDDLANMLSLAGRIVGMIAGIIILCIGIYFSTKVFYLVYDNMHSPEAFRETYDAWVKAVDRDEFHVKIMGEEYKLAPYLIFGFLMIGILLLAHVAVTIMVSGAKVISISSGQKSK